MVRVSPRNRSKNRTNYLISSIDVSAFAGIMMFFLFLFMNPAPVCLCKGTSVDMAKVSHPVNMRAADKEDAIIVTVNRDGKVFLGTDPTKAEWLHERIRERAKNGAENRVYIKADAHAKYGWVKEVLDEVRASGIQNVGFLVDQRKTGVQNPQSLQ